VKQNFSSVYQIRNSGSGQILQPRQLYRSPGLAKIAPSRFFSKKAGTQPPYMAGPLAVTFKNAP
jgi:hypothetical protein